MEKLRPRGACDNNSCRVFCMLSFASSVIWVQIRIPILQTRETEAWRGEVMLVMYPTAVFFAQVWHLLESKTDKQDISLTEELWLHVPSPRCGNTLLLRVGGLLGVGFPGNQLHTDPPIPKEGKQPTLEICGGKAQVTLSCKHGRHCPHLQRKEQGFSKL